MGKQPQVDPVKFRLDEDFLQIVPGMSGPGTGCPGGVTIPGSVQKTCGCGTLGSWAPGEHGGAAGLMIGLGYLRGLFQPNNCGSVGRDHQCRSGSLVPRVSLGQDTHSQVTPWGRFWKGCFFRNASETTSFWLKEHI